ncbi:MarR family winged helix-turn-helix transcriptional regulator [Azospirillum agricola]|uniref:MarR family winged helix-turn-helix transcriptional regulator n=1 Tax=Azospirillum agricola TaxID=1720247 RepID=UPI000A0F3812|nr:MarR family winged helix-turn-helix transcriptional regulator [Azospirillum agricola]SMH46505.1 transcriptional regulator, MarR family [Azospirillum lipoferum]
MTESAPKRPQVRRPKAPATALPAAPPQDMAPADTIDLGLLSEAVGFLLKRAQMAVFNDFNRTFAEADIRPAQFSVLTIIGRNPGLRQSQVSNALSIKRTNFVPLLDSLEARGLVKRKLATTDRRSHALHLTAKGAVLVKELNALWTQHEQRIRDQIGEEGRTRLLELLGRLVEFGGPGLADEGDAAEAPPAKPRKPRAPKASPP